MGRAQRLLICSICTGAGCLDRLVPSFGVLGKEAAELFGGAAERARSQEPQPFCCMSTVASTAFVSAFRRSTIGPGMPAAAMMPHLTETIILGQPD
jgi:hypothetical protein